MYTGTVTITSGTVNGKHFRRVAVYTTQIPNVEQTVGEMIAYRDHAQAFSDGESWMVHIPSSNEDPEESQERHYFWFFGTGAQNDNDMTASEHDFTVADRRAMDFALKVDSFRGLPQGSELTAKRNQLREAIATLGMHPATPNHDPDALSEAAAMTWLRGLESETWSITGQEGERRRKVLTLGTRKARRNGGLSSEEVNAIWDELHGRA